MQGHAATRAIFDDVADSIACVECGGAIRRGPTQWACTRCNRRWPAVLGIPDFRPEGGEQMTAQVARLVEAFPGSSFDDLVQIRTPNFSTDDEGLRKKFTAYRTRMSSRGGAFYGMVRQRVAELLAPFGDDLALVVGCGAGASMLELAPDFAHVIGVDPSLEDLILARKAVEEQDLAAKITLIQGYAQAMPVVSHSVDFAIAEDVLEHVRDLEGTFAEIGRVLASEGVFAGNSVNRFNMLRPEPHVRLWLVGFLPRAWQGRYVEWRRQFHGYDRMCRLPSYRELAGALRRKLGDGARVVFPGVGPYGFPPSIDRALRAIERLGPLATPLLWVFPSHLAVAKAPSGARA